MDLNYLKEISSNDESFILEILNTYLEEVPKDIQIIKGDINKIDKDAICSIAHKLKSSFMMLGFEELSLLSKEIELSKNNVLDNHHFKENVNCFVKKVEESLFVVKDYVNRSI